MSSSIPAIRVFKPTMEEFANFNEYIKSMEEAGAHHAGIAKIIPPKGWKPRKRSYDDVGEFVISTPVQQQVIGKSGLYTQLNMQHKAMSVKEFEQLATSAQYCPPRHDGIDDLERKYWKNISYSPPIYGADIPGSLYDDDQTVWNLNSLGTILDMVKHHYGVKIEGVNTAYLYFGMWKTTFPWHTEDMELYSINYLHYGADKFWYAVPPEHGKRIERLATGFFPDSAKNCSAFLRHKMYIISPAILHKFSIPYNKIRQKAGEFIVTFPYGYHSGFNTGYNCAESTNFATERWIDYGKRAILCSCMQDTVRILMDPFVKKFQPDQYEEWLATKAMHVTDKVLEPYEHCTSHSSSDGTSTSMLKVSRRHPLASNTSPSKRCRRKTPEKVTPEKVSLFSAEPNDGQQASTSSNSNIINNNSISNSNRKMARECKLLSGRSPGGKTELQQKERTAKASICSVSSSSTAEYVTVDPSQIGMWAVEIRELWQYKLHNLNAERQYNLDRSGREPHCCLCQYFVSSALLRTSSTLPKQSRRILTDVLFSKDSHPHPQFINTTTSVTPDTDGGDQDLLLTCKTCGICVHPTCYGVNTASMWYNPVNWKCTRCQIGQTFAECCLCCLRGGALQPTTDGGWCHLVCALLIPGVSFVSTRMKQPIDITALRTSKLEPTSLKQQQLAASIVTTLDSTESPQYRLISKTPCSYCHNRVGATVYCSLLDCSKAFHVTCAFEAGANFELRDWPVLMSAVCSHHNVPGGNLTDFGDNVDLRVNTAVKVCRDDGEELGKVIGEEAAVFCVVDFEDGTYSNNLYINDIESCSCGPCDGAHASGSRVKIRWVDGRVYEGLYRRAYKAPIYHVRTANGEVIGCTREELTLPEDSDVKSDEENSSDCSIQSLNPKLPPAIVKPDTL